MKTFLISILLFAYSAAHAVYIAKIENFSLQPAAIWYGKRTPEHMPMEAILHCWISF